MSDIIKATIYSDLKTINKAYEQFAKCPGVVVVRINEQLKEKQTVTLNFVFKMRCIGELIIKLSEPDADFYAYNFLNKMQNAKTKFEMIDILNNRAAYMAKNNQLS